MMRTIGIGKTVKEILTEYLKANGFDGLYIDDCGCTVDDIAPCGHIDNNCTPGYLRPCDCGCDNHIGPKE